jgi:RHS repeat-associated protein
LGEIQAVDFFADVAKLELDENFPDLYTSPGLPFQPKDPNPFAGRVLYGPGLVIDQPLSIQRYVYKDFPRDTSKLTWPTFTIIPYWNSAGVPAFGSFSDGAAFKPYQLSGGQTACPFLGSGANNRCVIVQWPAAHSAYDQNRGNVLNLSWHGSLLEAKRDRTGYQYHRNRYYDPKSSRFTQEDPIGLAGGLNLYGFANGDPVNLSDPFGLQSCKDPASRTCKDAIASVGLMDDPFFNLLLLVFSAGGSAGARAALATREARALGIAGEASAGIVRNTQRIASATGTAAWRIPDALTATTLTEVKNVASLSLTNQIRDFAAFAAETGRVFELVIREGTRLSKPLLDFIVEKNIHVRFLP